MTTLYDLAVDAYEPAETHAIRTVSYLLTLGDGELQVLSLIAERLAQGRATYGPLDIHGDHRDWRVELGMEAADALVYAAAEALRRAPEKRRETVPVVIPPCSRCAGTGIEYLGSGRDYCGCSLGAERREQDERRELNRTGGRS